MGRAKRKMKPQPSWEWLLDNDNCWFCKNRNNCGSCKLLKQHSSEQRKKRERAEEVKLIQSYKKGND